MQRQRRAGAAHVKIAVDIKAVDINLFFLYSTGTMIMLDCELPNDPPPTVGGQLQLVFSR